MEEFQNKILTKIFHNENFKTEIKVNEKLANYGTKAFCAVYGIYAERKFYSS